MNCDIIRPEMPGDMAAIQIIHIEAFANHPISHQTEHFIVNALRRAGALALSLVAEREGQIVGHVAFSRVMIDGRDQNWFMLGPVGVLPNCQKQGIGSALVRKGLERLKDMGADGCVLVGDPGFYARFGFSPRPGLVLPGIPPEYFMGTAFTSTIPSGMIAHHDAFFASC
ncbi:MAG TPA: GNAT family N-acetyltransferase [Rhodospirillaceae bacterium]|nr:MAG: GNAT family N-acetyltransferase [Alphaproteobacteria bacterium GWF2_58_20]HAU28964.1 GNAT family N-acetyltransferase [Rhodospirillaceae bacterium]